MSVATAPDPAREPAPRGRAVLAAAWGGFLAWLPLALGGQLIAWTGYAITRSFRPWSWVKLGLLNTIAVARVDLVGRVEPPPGVPVEGHLFGTGTLRFTIALGAGTIVALVLLFRAGRAAARGATDRPRTAGLLGAAVAIGFALPMGISALAVTLRFPTIDIGVLRPQVWQAFAWPFALGIVVGGLGGLSASRVALARGVTGRRIVAVARGAWHALVWGVVLAFLGTLALATVQPRVTSSYGRWLEGQGGGGAFLAMYHALLAPNQSVDVLATSMGACTRFTLGEGTSRVCLGGVDVGDALTELIVGGPTRDGSRHVAFGPGYLAFLLVPAIATVAGGRRAAAGVRSRGERASRGAWSGATFGLLAGASAWVTTISIAGDRGTIASLGADPVEVAAFGLVWGVVGGALGSMLPDPAGTPQEPPLSPRDEGAGSRAQAPDDELPSETSLK